MRPGLRLWLLVACLGLAALLVGAPYLAATLGPLLEALPNEASPGKLLAAQLAQLAVMVVLAAGVGAKLAWRVGLRAPALEAWARGERAPRIDLLRPLLWGSGAALALLVLFTLVLAPRLPRAIVEAETGPWYLSFLTLVYGGVLEEILLRWGALTLLLWLALRARMVPAAAFWIANALAALLFAAGHLGTAALLAGGLTPWLVGYVLGANAALSLLFGWISRRHGLEAAMVAHAAADLWLHVVPALLRALS